METRWGGRTWLCFGAAVSGSLQASPLSSGSSAAPRLMGWDGAEPEHRGQQHRWACGFLHALRWGCGIWKSWASARRAQYFSCVSLSKETSCFSLPSHCCCSLWCIWRKQGHTAGGLVWPHCASVCADRDLLPAKRVVFSCLFRYMNIQQAF